MVIHRNRKDFLRLILTNYILIQKFLHFFRFDEINLIKCLIHSGIFLIQDFPTNIHALIANICTV